MRTLTFSALLLAAALLACGPKPATTTPPPDNSGGEPGLAEGGDSYGGDGYGGVSDGGYGYGGDGYGGISYGGGYVARTYDPPLAAWDVECAGYEAAAAKLVTCDKVPAATKDALQQGMVAFKDALTGAGGMPPEAQTAMAEGCRQGAEALVEAGASMGCP